MKRLYIFFLLAMVAVAFSACSDDDAPSGKKPNTDGFFTLDAESLKDWDYGLSDGQCCLVFKADSAGGILACAIDKDSGKRFDFFIELDGDGKLTGLGTPDEYYAAAESDDDYTLFKWNDSGELEGTTVSKTSGNQKIASRKIGVNGQPEFANTVGKMYGIYGNLKNAGILGQAWQEGRWGDFFKQLGDIIAADLIGKLKNGGIPGVVITMRVNAVKQEINDNNAHWLYGSASIMITGISKLPDGTYWVTTEISGISSIPRTVPINYIDAATLRPYATVERENRVYAGVVCRQDFSAFINYYDYMAEEEDITSNGSDVAIVQFSLPALGNGTYKVKPYLRSSINDELDSPPGQIMAAKPYSRVLPGEWATTGTRYILYGNEEEINNIGGKITDFTQADARFMHNNPYEEGYVNFVAYLTAEIDSNDDLEEWGVYYMSDSKYGIYQRFPADMPTAKVKDEIMVEFTVNRYEFDYMDYTNFTASKNMKFGVYKKYKNPTGNYDYLTYYYGDMSEFTVTYDKKPTVEVYDTYVTGERPYDGDDPYYEKWCDFSFKAKLDGCLFMTCPSRIHGSEWNNPNVNYPICPDEGDCMSDRMEYTFSTSYAYTPDNTNSATMYIGIWLWPYNGQYDELSTPYAIYCDNGSVSLITNANTVYSKGTAAHKHLVAPVAAKPQRTVNLPVTNK